MRLKLSRWVATAGFLLLVPAAIWLAYRGSDHGLYSYYLVPIAFGVILTAGLVGLFVVLPRLRELERTE